MVRYLTMDEALRQIEIMSFKVRDSGLLDSALYRPRSGFGGIESYPTVPLKAAAMLHSLAMNHPLFDGNKRYAWVATQTFLWLNTHGTALRGDEIVDLMLAVVTGQFDSTDEITGIADALAVSTLEDLP